MTADELMQAVAQARQMPASVAKVQALELLVRKAQQQNRPAVEFRALFHLYNAGNEIGSAERRLAAYTALRALAATHGEAFRDLAGMVLDVGAHLASSISSFPEISLAQIWELLAELEESHVAAGRPLYVLHEARVSILLKIGHLDEAAAAYEQLEAAVPEGAFCNVCRVNQRVWFLQRMQRDVEAIELAAPIVDGRMTCDSVPWSTWGTLLTCHRRLDELAIAGDYFLRGYKYVFGAPQQVSTAAELIQFAPAAGELPKGTILLRRALPNTAMVSKATLLDLDTAAVVLLDALAAGGGKTLRLPIEEDADARPIPALREHFASRARDLAAQFDRRNRNSFVSDELAAAIGR